MATSRQYDDWVSHSPPNAKPHFNLHNKQKQRRRGSSSTSTRQKLLFISIIADSTSSANNSRSQSQTPTRSLAATHAGQIRRPWHAHHTNNHHSPPRYRSHHPATSSHAHHRQRVESTTTKSDPTSMTPTRHDSLPTVVDRIITGESPSTFRHHLDVPVPIYRFCSKFYVCLYGFMFFIEKFERE